MANLSMLAPLVPEDTPLFGDMVYDFTVQILALWQRKPGTEGAGPLNVDWEMITMRLKAMDPVNASAHAMRVVEFDMLPGIEDDKPDELIVVSVFAGQHEDLSIGDDEDDYDDSDEDGG